MAATMEGKEMKIDKETLYKLYWEEERSASEIARMLGVSPSTVIRWMKKHGLPRRNNSEKMELLRRKQRGGLKITRELLEKMYVDECMSAPEIAKKLGVNSSTVQRWLRKYGLIRDAWTTRRIVEERKRREKGITKKKIEELYMKLKNYKKVAEQLGIPPSSLWYLIKKYGIKIKPSLRQVDFSKEKEICYILGVLLGDGYVYKGKTNYFIHLKVTSKTFAESFCKALKEIGLTPHLFWYEKEQRYIAGCSSKIFYNFYKNLTLKDIRKLVTKNKENMKEFIRGFYESEGTNVISSRKKGWTIAMYNTNLDVILLVKFLLEKLGFNFSVRKRKLKGRKLTIKGRKTVARKDDYILASEKHEQNRRFIETIKPVIRNKIPEFSRKRWKWTKEEVVKSIMNIYEEIGEIPSSAIVTPTLCGAARKYFGSWTKALKKIFELKEKKEITCTKCGYKWYPKSIDPRKTPKICPKCKSRKIKIKND